MAIVIQLKLMMTEENDKKIRKMVIIHRELSSAVCKAYSL